MSKTKFLPGIPGFPAAGAFRGAATPDGTDVFLTFPRD
jgi:hypothetical protein